MLASPARAEKSPALAEKSPLLFALCAELAKMPSRLPPLGRLLSSLRPELPADGLLQSLPMLPNAGFFLCAGQRAAGGLV